MDPFSFEQDVAPLRGSYFSTTGASGRQRTAVEQRSLQQSYLRNTAPLQDRAVNMLVTGQRLRMGEQALEQNRLQLQEQRRQMKQQREFAAKLPESMSALTGILTADADPGYKEQGLAEFAVRNPSFMANPAGADLFRSVISGISSQRAVKDAEEREAREAKAAVDRLAFGLTETGNVKALERLNQETGGAYKHMIPVADEVGKAYASREKMSADAKLALERQAADIKAQEEGKDDEDEQRQAIRTLFEKAAFAMDKPEEGTEDAGPRKLPLGMRALLNSALPFVDRTIDPNLVPDLADEDLISRGIAASLRRPISIPAFRK